MIQLVTGIFVYRVTFNYCTYVHMQYSEYTLIHHMYNSLIFFFKIRWVYHYNCTLLYWYWEFVAD